MSDATKNCPMCGEQILAVAVKCRYCGAYLDASLKRLNRPDVVERSLLPVGRPASAIAAGYLALFAVLPIFGLLPGILAVIFGILALKKINRDPSLCGKGRAWFGIIVGGLVPLIWIAVFAIAVSMENHHRW
jgi:hypothetical protein